MLTLKMTQTIKPVNIIMCFSIQGSLCATFIVKKIKIKTITYHSKLSPNSMFRVFNTIPYDLVHLYLVQKYINIFQSRTSLISLRHPQASERRAPGSLQLWVSIIHNIPTAIFYYTNCSFSILYPVILAYYIT